MTRRSWLVWLGLVVVIAVSLYGINRLTVINSLKSLFFEATQFRKDDAALNKYFGGTATFYVYLEGQEPDALKNPAVLHAIENLQKEIEAIPEVGKTQSYVDYVKATNQSMHGGDTAYRTIPDSQATISEYIFLFSLSGSDGEMNRFLDYQYQKSVIWVFLRDDSTVLGEKLISIVNKYSKSLGLFTFTVAEAAASGSCDSSSPINCCFSSSILINCFTLLVFSSALCALLKSFQPKSGYMIFTIELFSAL